MTHYARHMVHNWGLTTIIVLFFITISTVNLHAQDIMGKRINDAILTLGTDYVSTRVGPVTKLSYGAVAINNPHFGKFTEYDDYDFLDDVCEARHTFLPLALKQDFIDYLNTKFGRGDHLWRGDNDTYIAIKVHDDNFELMIWTPTYEKMLDKM